MGKGERLAYFDFLRGVAILMVVAIHTYSGGGFETPMGWLRMCVRQAVACAVPVFLAVSGFFLARKALKTWSERWVFWRKQIPKVYIPCVVWSVLAVGHGWVFAESLTTWGVVRSLLFLVLCGCSVYYFIALIIQCYVLLPWLTDVKMGGVIASAFMSFSAVAVVDWYLNIEGHAVPLLIYAGPFPVYGFFFVLGVWLSRQPRTYKLFPLVVLLLLSLVLSMWETKWQMSFHGGGIGIKPSAYLYSAFAVFILFSRRLQDAYMGRGLVARGVQWIGGVSFGVYLVHMNFIGFAPVLSGPGRWLAGWMVTTLLTLAFIVVVKRLMPRFSVKYLGFR